MRGLVTAFPIVRPGCSYLTAGVGVAGHKAADGFPLPWFHLRLCAIENAGATAWLPRLSRDGPHEAGEFAGDCRADHCGLLAPSAQRSIPSSRPGLGFPCNLSHPRRGLPIGRVSSFRSEGDAYTSTRSRPASVELAVAGLRDAAPSDRRAGRPFFGTRPRYPMSWRGFSDAARLRLRWRTSRRRSDRRLAESEEPERSELDQPGTNSSITCSRRSTRSFAMRTPSTIS